MAGEPVSKVRGLWGSSGALFLAELFDSTAHSIFVVTPDSETAETLLTDLRFFSRFFPSQPASFSFPYWEILPYDTILPHTDITHIRMSGYLALLSGKRGIFVSPAYSMIQQVIKPGTLQGLIKKIEPLRSFDPETQRSVSQMDSAVIMPAVEGASGGSLFEYLSDDDIVVFDEAADIKQNASEYWSQILEIYKDALLQGRRVAEPEKLYFPWDEIADIRSLFKRKIDIESIPIEGTSSVIINSISSQPCHPELVSGSPDAASFEILKQVQDDRRDESSLKKKGERPEIFRKENLVIVVSPTDGQAGRFREVFLEYDVPAIVVDAKDGENPPLSPFFNLKRMDLKQSLPVHIISGHLSSGFLYPEASLLFITEEEIFGKRSRRPTPPKQKARPLPPPFQDLREGDYVVHLQHGIGQYDGLVRKTLSGGGGGFLCIRYSGTDYGYLPVSKR